MTGEGRKGCRPLRDRRAERADCTVFWGRVTFGARSALVTKLLAVADEDAPLDKVPLLAPKAYDGAQELEAPGGARELDGGQRQPSGIRRWTNDRTPGPWDASVEAE